MTLSANTSVAHVIDSNATTSVTFTPPANSLVVVFATGDESTGSTDETLDMSTSTGISMTLGIRSNGSPGGTTELWWGVGSGSSVTIKVTDNKGAVAKSVKVIYYTDSGGATPVFGDTDVNGSNPSNLNPVSGGAGSWAWCNAFSGTNFTTLAGHTLQDHVDLADGFDGGDTTGVYSLDALATGAGQSMAISKSASTNHFIAVSIDIATGATPAVVGQPDILPDPYLSQFIAQADVMNIIVTSTAVDVTVVDDYSAQAALAADILPAERALSDTLAAVDVPLGGLAAGFTTESVIVDVTVTDGPSGALAGNVTETLAVDQILTDSPSGALAAAVGESASVGVTITDSAFGALASSVTESAIVDVTVTDSPAAALGHIQPQETTDSVTLVVDVPSAALGASVSESVAADVLTPVDAPSAALGHSQPGESAGAVVIVTDTAPLAAIGGNPSESVAIDIVVTDNPAASVAAQAIESVAVGIAISDQPSAALAAGGTREVVTIDIIILDTPSGVIAAIATDGQVAAGVTVSDSPLASLAGGALVEEQGSQGAPDIVIFDTVHAALAAAWQEVARAAGPADITAHIRTATVSTHVAAATVASHVAAGQISSVIEEAQVDSHVMQANIESHVRG